MLRSRRIALALVGAGVVALVSAYLPSAGQTASIASYNKQVSARYLAGGAADSNAATGGDHDSNASQPTCGNCQPPVTYRGGPLLGSTGHPGDVTITPIYWAPAGYSYPASYQTIINQYITDIAHDSGLKSNVYAVNTEYSQVVNGVSQQMAYALHAGAVITDSTTPFPTGGCTATPGHGYTACVTSDQIHTEITKAITAAGQPGDLSHIYIVLFPPNVQAANGDAKSLEAYCGIHSDFRAPGATTQTVYSEDVFVPSGNCNIFQEPNGSEEADGQIGVISHELNESLTDPVDAAPGYQDGTGQEVGDECGGDYGPPLGYTQAYDMTGTLYNQVINGHKYYTQSTFSSLGFAAGNGCMTAAYGTSSTPKLQTAHDGPTDTGGVLTSHDADGNVVVPTHSTVTATPDTIPADGSTTSELSVTVLDDDN